MSPQSEQWHELERMRTAAMRRSRYEAAVFWVIGACVLVTGLALAFAGGMAIFRLVAWVVAG